MKKIIDGTPKWVDDYNTNEPKKIGNRKHRPNFVNLTAEHFNGSSGDTVTLYEVAKFIEKLYNEWTQ